MEHCRRGEPSGLASWFHKEVASTVLIAFFSHFPVFWFHWQTPALHVALLSSSKLILH